MFSGTILSTRPAIAFAFSQAQSDAIFNWVNTMYKKEEDDLQ